MRKIKITALILAVLMVMAAFAGCASKSAVEDLDDRVSALEGKIEANQKENADKLDEMDKNNASANEALLDAIKDLTDKITELEEANKQNASNNNAAATLEGIKNGYIKDLNEKKIGCDLNKAEYADADYKAVITALTNGVSDVTAATTEEAAKAAYEAAVKVYTEKATIATFLIDFYTKAKAGLTKDSKELIETIDAYVNGTAANGSVAAVPSTVAVAFGIAHVAGTDLNAAATELPKSITNYKNGEKNADGSDKEINLITALQAAIAAYEYVAGSAFNTLVENAKTAIKNIGTVDLNNVAKVTTARTEYDKVVDQVKGITAPHAAWIADSVLDLVDNAATLTAAEKRVDELATAKVVYIKAIGDPDGVGGYVSAFNAYKALAVTVDYKKIDVYTKINDRLAAWAETYKLEPANIKIIVDGVEGAGTYDKYIADNHKVALFAKAATTFKAIANRVKTLSASTTLNGDAFKEYTEIKGAIDGWKKVQAKDTTSTNALLTVDIYVDDYNFAQVITDYELNRGVTFTLSAAFAFADNADIGVKKEDYTSAKNYVALYAFDFNTTTKVDGPIATFYKVTFNAASTAAGKATTSTTAGTGINGAISNIDLTKVRSIATLLAIDGTWKEVSTGVWEQKKIEKTDIVGAIDTIAEFKAEYVTDSYDLSYLVNEADFTKKLEDAKKLIADQKVIADSLAATVKKITTDLNGGAFNLTKKEDLESAWTKYQDGIKKAGINVMKEFVLKENSTTQYEYKLILSAADATALESWNTSLKNLLAKADAVITLYNYLKKVNEYKAFAALTLATEEAIMAKLDVTNAQNGRVNSYYDYLKADGTAVLNIKDATTANKAGVGTQFAVLNVAETLYQAFKTANSNKKYAPVDDLRDSFKAYNFEAIKSLVIAEVDALGIDNEADYLASIAGATTEDEVHNIIADIYVRSGKTKGTNAVTFGGVEVVKAASAYVVE